jgi:hypothetical protein
VAAAAAAAAATPAGASNPVSPLAFGNVNIALPSSSSSSSSDAPDADPGQPYMEFTKFLVDYNEINNIKFQSVSVTRLLFIEAYEGVPLEMCKSVPAPPQKKKMQTVCFAYY